MARYTPQPQPSSVPPMDDPYNFVDEDDSMSKPPIGMQQMQQQQPGLVGGPQMQQQQLMSGSGPPNNQMIYQTGPPQSHLQGYIGPPGVAQSPVMTSQQPQQPEKTAKKRGRKKKADEIR